MAARKKRHKKASKKVTRKRRRRKATVHRVASSGGGELTLLHKIDKKVTRIDRTVNAGKHLARKAKRAAARRHGIEQAWEDVERHGME